MPVDSEVAKERIWKEHCEKMVLQSMKFRQEGRSHAEFTLNPYHMHHNKPVTDPVSTRSPNFMDRSKATLDALGQRLANTGLSPRGEGGDDISSPNKAARSNKSRAIKGNNIFGSLNASDESKRKLFEEWSEMLNEELGGGKSFRESTSTGFLPPINNPRSPANNKQNNNTSGSPTSVSSPTKPVDSPSSKRDEVIQEMLIRSSKPPVAKYDRPQLESQVLGWDASRALRPDPMFQFYHKSCDMTRFAAESGHSPSKRGGGPTPAK